MRFVKTDLNLRRLSITVPCTFICFYQRISELHRLEWKVLNDNTIGQTENGGGVGGRFAADGNGGGGMDIELKPMQIRTFVLRLRKE